MKRAFVGSQRESIVKALLSGAVTAREISDVVKITRHTITVELSALERTGRVERLAGRVRNTKGPASVRWRARVAS